MRKILFALAATVLGAATLAGCGDGPSTPVAADVKEPDNRNVSGAEILRRKQAADAQTGPPR